jgi:hypothetical protein
MISTCAHEIYHQEGKRYKAMLIRDSRVATYQVVVTQLYDNGAPYLDFEFNEVYKVKKYAVEKYRKICKLLDSGEWIGE